MTALGSRAAAALLDAGCMLVRADEPFRLPSGWASPVYMDCRRLISFPGLRRQLVADGLEMLRDSGSLEGVASVAGAEASGIALAAWMAESLDLPMQYVRKKAIGSTQVEGVVRPGTKALLVDDVMAGGQSAAKFCRALNEAGASVTDVFVLFDYGTFPASSTLAALGIHVRALATWRDLLPVARARGALTAQALDEIDAFLADPQRWSLAHGGIGRPLTRS